MKNTIVFVLFLLSLSAMSQKSSVKVETQESWPPGKMVPVTVSIVRGEAEGFARFYHNLPQGFIVENVISSEADFFRDNNQVNYVWVDLPSDRVIVIQYLAQADELLAGSFRITGRFDYIVGGSERVSVAADPVVVQLDRNATVDSIVDVTGKITVNIPEETVAPVKEEDNRKSEVVDFRVQVSISSQQFSLVELEERIGCSLKHGITVLSTGNMFKYQSGSFTSYSDAYTYLDELKNGGVKDAFIVSFKDNIQIPINEARSITEK